MDFPLLFRYSDTYSINKFTINSKESTLLPLWIVEYVTFGIVEDDYRHVLRLKPKEG